jgi:hypothetical protein
MFHQSQALIPSMAQGCLSSLAQRDRRTVRSYNAILLVHIDMVMPILARYTVDVEFFSDSNCIPRSLGLLHEATHRAICRASIQLVQFSSIPSQQNGYIVANWFHNFG